MRRTYNVFLQVIIISFTCFTAQAQYTETINSNRPGNSQGAFSVGTGVLQLEAGGYFGEDDHYLRRSETDVFGTDYSLRYGLFFEALEVSLTGSFQYENITQRIGNTNEETSMRSNFRTNTLGVKYMIFDPSRSIKPREPNLYSWKANQRFDWKKLIPAVAVYAGANFSFGENPYLYEGEGNISPKFAVVTQNNWAGGWVFVTNFIADKLTEEFPSFAGIFTLTHAFTPKFAGFLEYHGIISNVYADDLARTGVAYLLNDNLQLDLSGLLNFKNTPDRWQIAAGFSYRLDRHTQDEFIEDDYDGDRNQNTQETQEEGEDGN